MEIHRLGGYLKTERRLINRATREALRFLGRAHRHSPRRPLVGAPPDEILIPPGAPTPRIEWLQYTPDELRERQVVEAEELRAALGSDAVDWIHVQGFGDEEVLRTLAEVFGIHSLALADIVNGTGRPKADHYGDRDILILQGAHSEGRAIDLHQVSFVVGPGWVLTFAEGSTSELFDPVRARLRARGSSIRKLGADFLAYALIDAVVDSFFSVTDSLSDILEELEESAIGDPESHTLARIHSVRRWLIRLERTQRHQRDVLLSLPREEEGPFGESVRPYLRDTQGHAIRLLDTIETLREMTIGLMDIYASSVGNRANDVMKTLTVMASLFIPLNFIAGVYGMNFDNMPELHWRWGYVAIWALMAGIAGVLLVWFGRRGWLGTSRARDLEDA